MKLIAASIAALLLSISAFAQTTLPATHVEWAYLDSQPPGPCSALAYSLAGKPIRPEVSDCLKKQFRLWQDSDLPSVVEYEAAVLSLIKLGQNPTDYQGRNLLAALYPADALEVDGLDGVSGALLVYSASGQEIAQSQPNSPNALLDRMIAAQQLSGGFAQQPGHDPDISVTARAITALYPYQSMGADITAVIQRGLTWLGEQQNADGTFSIKGLPSGSTTAQVLIAASLCPPPPDTFTKGGPLMNALEHFHNQDGGYSEVLGGDSSPKVTELAIIARHVASTKMFPYYAPENDGAIQLSASAEAPVPTAQSENKLGSYLKFLFTFCMIFFLIYLILMLTIKIGKYAEKKKLPGSLAAQATSPTESADPSIHIPMQAQIPNFDDCTTRELEIGHLDDKPES